MEAWKSLWKDAAKLLIVAAVVFCYIAMVKNTQAAKESAAEESVEIALVVE